MCMWYTYICASSLLIDVDVGEVAHHHLVAPPPAVRHHWGGAISKCAFVFFTCTSQSE